MLLTDHKSALTMETSAPSASPTDSIISEGTSPVKAAKKQKSADGQAILTANMPVATTSSAPAASDKLKISEVSRPAIEPIHLAFVVAFVMLLDLPKVMLAVVSWSVPLWPLLKKGRERVSSHEPIQYAWHA